MTSRVVPSGSRSQRMAPLSAAVSIWVQCEVTRSRSCQITPATLTNRHTTTVIATTVIRNHTPMTFLLPGAVGCALLIRCQDLGNVQGLGPEFSRAPQPVAGGSPVTRSADAQ